MVRRLDIIFTAQQTSVATFETVVKHNSAADMYNKKWQRCSLLTESIKIGT